MTTRPPGGPAAGQVAVTPGRYLLDPDNCRVSFRTRHLFGLGAVNGELRVDAGVLDVREPIEASTAHIEVGVASFSTGNNRRDTDVRSRRFLDAEHHRHIVVDITSVERSDGRLTARGTLTVLGRPHPFEANLTAIASTGTRVTGTATSRVDRYAHGVKALRGMAGRHLDLEASIRAHSANEAVEP
jgi:polyisoprenoid-binding protein YceI